ncbi:TPMT family class I SAM-dependent methyltransferase [Aquiflexum sp. TKW24L]|uniref:methyltransferase domain-containing protein n=1 Tax=Aquiflexum sp. TKW24L TaxID=2942212 RepID=UPI0020BF8620|nr:methyltransferase domain-containing protein [Aquiflexum sp. TKW24L]MCL6257495.1 TPMT family class I SAM-dependent methyltransferase [Aquiflexum sp. TKW24L]
MSNILSEDYWTSRYQQNSIGWDVGEITEPIKQYLDQIENFRLKILVPGAGNGYEAQYALKKGFLNTYILDISFFPLQNFHFTNPDFPRSQIHHIDFFDHSGQYDLIIEQTFLCALPPEFRPQYVKKMKSLIKPGGKLVGLLFNRHFQNPGPPFGGEFGEYKNLFEKEFHILKMEECYNSIPARQGHELFFILQKSQ